MASIIPSSKPGLAHLTALNMLGAGGLAKQKAAFLAIRGYYPNTFGKKGANDRRYYDDYLAYVEGGLYLPVNANTDPNGFRPGYGKSEETKGIMQIQPNQICWYKPGLHKGRPAFRQAKPFKVWRDANIKKVAKESIVMVDGVPVYEDFGEFAANIHDSPETSTSSLGCITVPKSQFVPWRVYIYARLKELGLYSTGIPLLIVRNQDLDE